MAKTSCPALLQELLSHDIEVPALVTLLPSHHSKDNMSLRIFGHLEKMAIISVWFVLCLLGCFIIFCLGSSSHTLGSIYTVKVCMQQNDYIL